MAGMIIAYFLAFLGYIGLGFIQLHAGPSRDLRTAVILFRLQVRLCLASGAGHGLSLYRPGLGEPAAGASSLAQHT